MPWGYFGSLGSALDQGVNTLGSHVASAGNTLAQMFGLQGLPGAGPAGPAGEPGMGANPRMDQATLAASPALGPGEAEDAYGTRFSGPPEQVQAFMQSGATLPAQPSVNTSQPPPGMGPYGSKIPPIMPFVEPVQAPQLPPLRPVSVQSVFGRRRGAFG